MDATLDELLQPVGEEPAGCDPQAIESYDRLVELINSLDSIEKISIDWNKVADTSTTILKQHSKDLRTANFLTFAWFINHKFEGLTNGFKLLNGLVSCDYSEHLYPNRKKRKEKARAAPFAWLSTKLDKHFATQNYELPDDIKDADIAYENFQLLNDALRGYLVDETPLSTELNQTLRQYADEAKRVKEAQAAQEKAEPVSNQESSADVQAEPGQVVQKAARAEVPVSPPQGVTSGSDMTKVLYSVSKSLADVADFIHQQSMLNADHYFFNRLAKWILITELPESGVLPQQPNEDALASLDALEKSNNHQELLKQAESLFQKGAIFYLDLHRQVFNALKATNQNGAAEVVLSTTKNFVSRFPAIIDTTFSNGTPFVAVKTQLWLESTSSNASEEDSGNVAQQTQNNVWKDARKEANKKLVEGNPVDAIRVIDSLSEKASGMRDLAFWRFELAKIMLKTGYLDMVLLNLETLTQTLQQHKIDVWEPAFYKEVIKLNLDAHKTMSAKHQYDNEKLNEIRGLKRELINISPSEAIQYSEFGK